MNESKRPSRAPAGRAPLARRGGKAGPGAERRPIVEGFTIADILGRALKARN